MTTEQVLALVAALAAESVGIACAVHALMTKRDASSAVAWILLCVTLPLLGAFFYLTAGQDRIYRKRAFRVGLSNAAWRASTAGRRAASLAEHQRASAHTSPLVVDVEKLTRSPVLGGNALDLFVGGSDAYAVMLETIAHATRSVHLQYYIFDDDHVGEMFSRAMQERARAGVDVRLLYDAVGCHATDSAFWNEMRAAGIKVAPFMPLRLLRRRWQINLRNHRKLMVVDEQVAFTGSINIGKRHLLEQGGISRDLCVQVRGPAVYFLQEGFDRSWFFAQDEAPPEPRPWRATPMPGEEVLQIIESGPDEPSGKMLETLLFAIHRAQSSIVMVTPYFVPHRSLLEALVIALRRGLSLTLVLPRKTDSVLINAASRNYVHTLLVAGAHVFERPGPLLHMKITIIDDLLSVVGSSNQDNRSHFLNFELDLAVHGSSFARRARDLVDAEIALSTPVSPFREIEASRLQRLATRVASLFSPIL